eukprot:TsM_001207700 transcript=TsM_001207700 gene=TsM_001207700
MSAGTAFTIVCSCLLVSGFGYAERPTFPSCQSSVCHSGADTGYGCQGGICNYTCSQSLCHGFGNSVFPRKGIQEAWGSGALGERGCYGGNCGYWSGCKDGICGDFYDFTQCQADECFSGPFQGYGCIAGGNCQVVCHDGVCHSVDNYGQLRPPAMVTGYENAISGHGHDPMMTYGMPSFPTSVYTMDPVVLQSMLLNIPNLNQLLMSVDPLLLQSALMYAPEVGSFASNMNPHAFQSMIVGLPNIKDILASMDPVLLQSIVATAPGIDSVLIGTNPYFSQRMTPHVPKQKKVTKKPKTTTSRPSYEKPDSIRAIDPNATQLIISTMPSIPIHYANGLLNAAPSFVRYILKNHQNLHGLLANMDNKTLLYVTAHVPEFGKILSKKKPDTLKVVFDKLPNISKYLQALDPEVLQALVAKLPSLAEHVPSLPSTTTPPKIPTLLLGKKEAVIEEALKKVATETPSASTPLEKSLRTRSLK